MIMIKQLVLKPTIGISSCQLSSSTGGNGLSDLRVLKYYGRSFIQGKSFPNKPIPLNFTETNMAEF